MKEQKKKKPLFLRVIMGVLLGLAGLALLLAVGVTVAFAVANKTNGKLVSSGITRRYLLYVPESYNPDVPTSLVITLHGFSQWPAHQAMVSQWNDLADEEGFIVVYPEGTNFPRRWVASNIASDQPVDLSRDVQFIADLIGKLEQEYNLDPARIYANGFSNGGGMTFLLSCNLSERIAAVGGVAGAYLLSWEQCNPTRPVPMIAFHGTADPIVPFEGGPSHSFDIPFPYIPDWMAAKAAHNGCEPDAQPLAEQGDASAVQYGNCQQGADVIFYTIDGAGHIWPGGGEIPANIAGQHSNDVDATTLIWQFFIDHPMP